VKAIRLIVPDPLPAESAAAQFAEHALSGSADMRL